MPNHVSSHIRITGPKADRVALKELMAGESPFDFNNILPMPKELANIQVGGTTLGGIHYTHWRDGHMGQIGIPEAELVKLEAMYGSRDWWGWANRNWGTKWNAYDVSIHETTKALTYQITTAWADPVPVFDALSERFPKLTFEVSVDGEVDEPYDYVIGQGD